MVRFHWHVEQGLSAFCPPAGVAAVSSKEGDVLHVTCEVELAGQKETLPVLFTVPANWLQFDQVASVGVVLGHGSNAADWKGRLATDLAITLASQGYVVCRYQCKQKEQRRQKMFEKALDACATSPYGKPVSHWILAGCGNGARVAAVVGTRCRGSIIGYLFLGYPLREPLPSAGKSRRAEGEPIEDSRGPLLPLEVPMCFITGDSDETCSLESLAALRPQLASWDVRAAFVPECDHVFRVPGGRGTSAAAVRHACILAARWVQAVSEETLPQSGLPKLPDPSPAAAHARATATPTKHGHMPQQQALPMEEEGDVDYEEAGPDDAGMQEQLSGAGHEDMYDDDPGMEDMGCYG